MKILVTGAAGFIGAHAVQELAKDHEVVGIDNFNDYYSPAYKRARVAALIGNKASIEEIDITDKETLDGIFRRSSFELVCHLAAQAGVRYSIENPRLYEKVNVLGTLNVLEACRKFKVQKLVLASSSSVYGNNPVPWSEEQKTNQPVSLYGATKIASETLAYSYHHLYGLKALVLRFFTVYGPWGRPDMAYFKFARAIAKGEPIEVFGEGKMTRDFTYIDDIVRGVHAAVSFNYDRSDSLYEIINLGHSKPVELMTLIKTIEGFMSMECPKIPLPMQSGDMRDTYAKIEKAEKDLIGFNWKPNKQFERGIANFVEWFKQEDTQKILKNSGLL